MRLTILDITYLSMIIVILIGGLLYAVLDINECIRLQERTKINIDYHFPSGCVAIIDDKEIPHTMLVYDLSSEKFESNNAITRSN